MILFEEKQPLLTSYEKDVVEFINKNPMDFVNFSIKKIAANCLVSTGVISRLYQKLGFTSLRDLQFFVHYQIITSNFINEEMEAKTARKFAQTISNSYTYAINKIISDLNNNIFEMIVQKIIHANAVKLYGNSQSYISCNLLSLRLQNIGIYARFERDFSTLLLESENIKSKEIFVIFSHSGESKEITFLINLLQERNIVFVLITANKTLGSKYPLVINYEEQNPSLGGLVNLSLSQHFIIDILIEYIKKRLKYQENSLILQKWNKKEKK